MPNNAIIEQTIQTHWKGFGWVGQNRLQQSKPLPVIFWWSVRNFLEWSVVFRNGPIEDQTLTNA